MGLDTVELVMAIEEKFDISIPDADAERIVTVRDVIDYVYPRVQHAEAKACLTQRAFHRLRHGIRETLVVERKLIRPSTQWSSLVPLTGRREVWSRLRAALGADDWPELRRSTIVARLIGSASLTAGVTAFVVVPEHKPLASAIVAIAFGAALVGITRPLRVHFAPATLTIGQTADLLVARMPAELLPEDQKGWSHEQVRAAIRAIIADRLNLDPVFSDDAKIVDDLGAD